MKNKNTKKVFISVILLLISFYQSNAQAKFIRQNEKNKAVIKQMLFSKVGLGVYDKLTKPSDSQIVIPFYKFKYNGKKDLSTENILSSLQIDTAFASIFFFKDNHYLGTGVKIRDVDFLGGASGSPMSIDEKTTLDVVLKASSSSKQYFYINSDDFQQASYFEILCYLEKGQLKFISQYGQEVHEFSNITDLINFRIGSVEKFWERAEARKKKNEKSMKQ